MKFKVVIERYGLFARFGYESYSDVNFELSPPENLSARSIRRVKKSILTLFLTLRRAVYLYLTPSLSTDSRLVEERHTSGGIRDRFV
jgi:hypothetical protein